MADNTTLNRLKPGYVLSSLVMFTLSSFGIIMSSEVPLPLSPPPIQAISSRIPSQEDFWYKSIANFKVNPKPAVNPIPSQDLPDVTYLAVTPQSTQ